MLFHGRIAVRIRCPLTILAPAGSTGFVLPTQISSAMVLYTSVLCIPYQVIRHGIDIGRKSI